MYGASAVTRGRQKVLTAKNHCLMISGDGLGVMAGGCVGDCLVDIRRQTKQNPYGKRRQSGELGVGCISLTFPFYSSKEGRESVEIHLMQEGLLSPPNLHPSPKRDRKLGLFSPRCTAWRTIRFYFSPCTVSVGRVSLLVGYTRRLPLSDACKEWIPGYRRSRVTWPLLTPQEAAKLNRLLQLHNLPIQVLDHIFLSNLS